MKYKVITFGSASRDIFVFSKEFFNKKLCFSIGDKVETDKILIHTGGGGTNTAATFASQGIKTAYCGSVGNDYAGQTIAIELKKFGVSTKFLNFINKTTNHSVVLSKKEQGRVILIHRDASNYVPKTFSYKKLKAKWFYLAPLSGECAKKTKNILNYAKKHKIKIALNPSKEQIKLFKKDIKNVLSKTDIFIINDRERKLLFGNRTIRQLFKELKYDGIFATGNDKEMYFFNKENLYKIKFSKHKITDMTGAGDAGGAGLVAGLIRYKNIEKAIQLSYGNIVGCMQEWGAKQGLLKKGERYKKIKVKKII